MTPSGLRAIESDVVENGSIPADAIGNEGGLSEKACATIAIGGGLR
jgi:hypothetical protein